MAWIRDSMRVSTRGSIRLFDEGFELGFDSSFDEFRILCSYGSDRVDMVSIVGSVNALPSHHVSVCLAK